MREVLFQMGYIKIRGYGTMIAIGIILAVFMAERREPQNVKSRVVDIGIWGLLGGFLCAKLLFWITEIPSIIQNPNFIMLSLKNGFVVYGGIIGGIISGLLYCKKSKISFYQYFDLVMPSVALAQGFGRIGCLMAGCCYGRETSLPIGIVFKESNFAPNGLKLLPTQIFMSIGDFILCIFLLIYAKKNVTDGRVGCMYLILYSVGRFLIEFLRADERGNVGALSTSQFIAIVLLIIGIVMFCLLGKGRKIRK